MPKMLRKQWLKEAAAEEAAAEDLRWHRRCVKRNRSCVKRNRSWEACLQSAQGSRSYL